MAASAIIGYAMDMRRDAPPEAISRQQGTGRLRVWRCKRPSRTDVLCPLYKADLNARRNQAGRAEFEIVNGSIQREAIYKLFGAGGLILTDLPWWAAETFHIHMNRPSSLYRTC